ncbi:DUF2019 domain-containing protein [Myxococcus sp. MISCRS1]|uniref:DUF2019 domain-containing protein n=1 Tax=unclassified Myxococcus TaxID=2648731 RepID=UPI001142668E|nr:MULTISPECIES: DUF2019 domain-containing protein [unclassified Myxococcus]MCY1003602.1 DUF2019 domain-containing protein [Myxococcus sp. MISCRS1]BDT34790.1 DUF2019 domain-containing protein [Myxococcus sp. MH1]
MDLESLVAQFAENIAAQTDCIRSGDAKRGNKHADKAYAAFTKLRSLGDAGRDALASLFSSPRVDVRVTAAAFLLRHKPKEARGVLEEAARGEGISALGAQQTLKNWENGTWALDPLE